MLPSTKVVFLLCFVVAVSAMVITTVWISNLGFGLLRSSIVPPRLHGNWIAGIQQSLAGGSISRTVFRFAVSGIDYLVNSSHILANSGDTILNY